MDCVRREGRRQLHRGVQSPRLPRQFPQHWPGHHRLSHFRPQLQTRAPLHQDLPRQASLKGVWDEEEGIKLGEVVEERVAFLTTENTSRRVGAMSVLNSAKHRLME